MTKDTNYQLNTMGFYAQSHIQLLTKMLEMAGYHQGTPSFKELLKRTVEAIGQDNRRQYIEFAKMIEDLHLSRSLRLRAMATGYGSTLGDRACER